MMTIPASVLIGMRLLKDHAVGDTPADRFRSIVAPEHLDAACWMTTNEDERFRAAVGALMASYAHDAPEFERIRIEMAQIQAVSAMVRAAEAGVGIASVPELPADFVPIGLIGLWRARTKR